MPLVCLDVDAPVSLAEVVFASAPLYLGPTDVIADLMPCASFFSYQKPINIYERAQPSRRDNAEVQKEKGRTVWVNIYDGTLSFFD